MFLKLQNEGTRSVRSPLSRRFPLLATPIATPLQGGRPERPAPPFCFLNYWSRARVVSSGGPAVLAGSLGSSSLVVLVVLLPQLYNVHTLELEAESECRKMRLKHSSKKEASSGILEGSSAIIRVLWRHNGTTPATHVDGDGDGHGDGDGSPNNEDSDDDGDW